MAESDRRKSALIGSISVDITKRSAMLSAYTKVSMTSTYQRRATVMGSGVLHEVAFDRMVPMTFEYYFIGFRSSYELFYVEDLFRCGQLKTSMDRCVPIPPLVARRKAAHPPAAVRRSGPHLERCGGPAPFNHRPNIRNRGGARRENFLNLDQPL